MLEFGEWHSVKTIRLTSHRQSVGSLQVHKHWTALHILWSDDMPAVTLHFIFQAVVMAKQSYTTPAWWGFCHVAAHSDHLEAILQCSTNLPVFVLQLLMMIDQHYWQHWPPAISTSVTKVQPTLLAAWTYFIWLWTSCQNIWLHSFLMWMLYTLDTSSSQSVS